MNINLDEFVFYLNKHTVREKNWSLKKLVKKIREDETNFQRTLRTLREKTKDTNDSVDIRNYLVARTVNWYQLEGNERKLNTCDKKQLSRLKKYLEDVAEWGRFEMVTFSTLLFVFETNYIKDRLADIERKIVDCLLRDCPSLRSGYQLYQNLLYAVKKREIDTFKEYLNVGKTDLPEIYDRTLKTFKKFLPQIENALRYGYSNGPLECLNNHIKVLKRNAYGFRSFYNFKLRIMIRHRKALLIK